MAFTGDPLELFLYCYIAPPFEPGEALSENL